MSAGIATYTVGRRYARQRELTQDAADLVTLCATADIGNVGELPDRHPVYLQFLHVRSPLLATRPVVPNRGLEPRTPPTSEGQTYGDRGRLDPTDYSQFGRRGGVTRVHFTREDPPSGVG